MQNIALRVALFLGTALLSLPLSVLAQAPRFTALFPAARSTQPIDGRLLLLLSTDPSAKPRMQIDDTPKSQVIFGMDVHAMRPEVAVHFDENAAGYPIRTLADLPAGDYYVQFVLNRYETFHRADGKAIQLAPTAAK